MALHPLQVTTTSVLFCLRRRLRKRMVQFAPGTSRAEHRIHIRCWTLSANATSTTAASESNAVHLCAADMFTYSGLSRQHLQLADIPGAEIRFDTECRVCHQPQFVHSGTCCGFSCTGWGVLRRAHLSAPQLSRGITSSLRHTESSLPTLVSCRPAATAGPGSERAPAGGPSANSQLTAHSQQAEAARQPEQPASRSIFGGLAVLGNRLCNSYNSCTTS